MTKKLIALVGAMLLAATAQAEWVSYTEEDKFTGEASTQAGTYTFGGTPRSSWLVVRCKGNDLEVYMAFDYLNLTDAKTRRDWRYVKLKYIFDGGDVRGEQWFGYSQDGSGLLVVDGENEFSWDTNNDDRWFARQFIKRNTFSVRMNYYRAGQTDVTFNLNGASQHIKKVLKACGVTENRPRGDNKNEEIGR